MIFYLMMVLISMICFPYDGLSYQISIPHWEPHVSRVKVPVQSSLYTHRLPDTL